MIPGAQAAKEMLIIKRIPDSKCSSRLVPQSEYAIFGDRQHFLGCSRDKGAVLSNEMVGMLHRHGLLREERQAVVCGAYTEREWGITKSH